MRIKYLEFIPAVDIKKYIDCFWSMKTVDFFAPVPIHRVLPDGCMDIIFDFSCENRSYSSYFVGTMTTPATFALVGDVDILGVRFNPGCATPFFNVSANECLNEIIELDNIWGSSGSLLWEQLQGINSTKNRLDYLQNHLREVLSKKSEIDLYVDYAVQAICKSRGLVSSHQLEIGTGLSQRQLERKFKQHLGQSPKSFARVIRFKSVIESARKSSKLLWVDLAQDHGYSDQSHLIKDFREFAGVSPSEFIAER